MILHVDWVSWWPMAVQDGGGERGPPGTMSHNGDETHGGFTRRGVCMQQREFERTLSVQVFSPWPSRPLAFPLPSLVNIKTICVAETRDGTVPEWHRFTAHCNQSRCIGLRTVLGSIRLQTASATPAPPLIVLVIVFSQFQLWRLQKEKSLTHVPQGQWVTPPTPHPP